MKKNVLLVEDDPALRMVVREVLKNDFNIEEADNGDDGIDKGVNSEPDLIILDYHLPKRDGLEVIAAIKKAHPEIPVIVLTGYLNPDSEKQFNRLGASRIFPKPFNYRTLLEAVIDLSNSPIGLAPDTLNTPPHVQPATVPKPNVSAQLSDAQMLQASLNALSSIAEKIEFLQTITEKYQTAPNDIKTIRETARLMEAEIRKFYGKLNHALFESGNPNLPIIQHVNKPSLHGDN